MKECNAEQIEAKTASALEAVQEASQSKQYAVYVGLDVHKETIAVAIARPGRDDPEYREEIANTRKTVEKLIERLSREFDGEEIGDTHGFGASLCVFGLKQVTQPTRS